MEQKKYEIEPKTVEDSQYNTLLACPFCGRSATVEEIDFKIIGVPHYYYECFACKINNPKIFR